MKKYSAIVCASLLAITLGACGGGGDTDTAVSDPQTDGSTAAVGTVAEDGTAVVPGAGDASGAPPSVSFAPLQPEGESVVRVRSLPALIDSTPAAARINGTASGKADPFAGRVISVRPIPPDPEEVQPVFPLARGGGSPATAVGGAGARGTAGASPRTVGANAGGGRTATPTASGAGRNAGGAGAATGAGGGGGSATLPDLAARPPIPDPMLARGVEVTGIVQIGSRFQAIVKAPNEPTARYVTVGQRLSNGRVLVKRIENQGSEPVVILEEDGVEVVRAIGAPVEGSAGNATAQLPQLQPAS